MEKAYIILDEENVLMGIVKTETRAKALYICWKEWGQELGLNLIEFSKIMTCTRNKVLDNIDFYYFDGRDITKDDEEIAINDLILEIKQNNKYG